jgi:hypothetical protein
MGVIYSSLNRTATLPEAEHVKSTIPQNDLRRSASPLTSLTGLYRCPDDAITLAVHGTPSGKAGFFNFGPEILCYGRCSTTQPPAQLVTGLSDMTRHVLSDETTLGLPFDLTEAVDNLRQERYIAGIRGGRLNTVLSSRAVRNAYYSLRPLLSFQIRTRLQRTFLRGWDRARFPAWPVDTTVERLLEAVLLAYLKNHPTAGPIPFIWFWPNGAAGCVTMTHDVESRNGVAFIPHLMDVDDSFEIPASFQLVPEKRYPISSSLIQTIRDRHFEINVHDLAHDGNLFDARDAFLSRAKAINRYMDAFGAGGFRSGRLYRNPDWLGAIMASYDMSSPNIGLLDAQRGGCCTVFPFFIGAILELPLTTCQDYTLFKILGDYSIELWKWQAATIIEKHGLVSFLVHPDYLIDKRGLEVYKALLNHLRTIREENGIWIARPGDVNDWWRQRSQMRLVRDHGSWRILGPGCERARIGYIALGDAGIEYTN